MSARGRSSDARTRLPPGHQAATPPPSPPSAPPSGRSSAPAAGSRSSRRPTGSPCADREPRRRRRCFVCDTGGEIVRLRSASGLTPTTPDQAVMGVWLLRVRAPQGHRPRAGAHGDRLRARRRLQPSCAAPCPKDNEPALSFFSDIGSMAQDRRPGHAVRAAAVRQAKGSKIELPGVAA